MSDVPGLREYEARQDRDWQIEIAAAPLADELLDVLSNAALDYLANLPLRKRTEADSRLRQSLQSWAQAAAQDLVEARAKEAEPVGGWE